MKRLLEIVQVTILIACLPVTTDLAAGESIPAGTVNSLNHTFDVKGLFGKIYILL